MQGQFLVVVTSFLLQGLKATQHTHTLLSLEVYREGGLSGGGGGGVVVGTVLAQLPARRHFYYSSRTLSE